jgi:hypothetical protein
MRPPSPLSISISFLTDFIISAGGCLTTAMVATGQTTMPAIPVIVFSVVTGLVAAARRVQAMLEQNPVTTTKTIDTDPGGAKREVTTSTPTPTDPPKGATP